MCAACTLRLFASVVCSSDISSSDFSVALNVLESLSGVLEMVKYIPDFVELVFVLLQHVLVLLRK
jgi:hypothetical protein